MIRTFIYPVTAFQAITVKLTDEQNMEFDNLSDFEKANVLYRNLSNEEKEHTSIQLIYKHFKSVIQHSQPEKGICRVCGCTSNDACTHPVFGSCWWADEAMTLCSHCAIDKIKNDPFTKGPRGVKDFVP